MLRIFTALAALCLTTVPALDSPATAGGVGLVTGEADLSKVTSQVRDAGDFRFAVFPGPVPAKSGVLPVTLNADEELFLIEADHADTRAAILATSRLIQPGESFMLVAATEEQSRQLDRLGACRERVTWIDAPTTGASPSPLSLSRADPAVKLAIINALSQSRYSQLVRELSGNIVFWLDDELESTNNRYTHTAGSGDDIDLAAAYLQDRFEAAGYPVTRQSFTVGSTTTDNIIAIKQGTTNAGEIIVVGAHYDSTSENPTSLAPGAEDNGSGTAAVLHLAEVLADYETERTVHFICFSGEEQGLYGSQHYVSELGSNGWNVVHALTMDMIAGWESNYRVIIEGQPAWETLMSLVETNVATHAQIASRKDYFSFGSDHVPFQQAGISALLAIDWDYGSYDHYHRTTDTWQYLDASLGHRILKGVAGTLIDLTNPTPLATAAPDRGARFRLEQNSPNPFNPNTVIRFQLEQDGPVSLAVYDLAGRRVQTLVDRRLDAGRHLAQWRGTDAAGRQVSSGTYILRLESGGRVESRRMVLVR